MNNNNMLFSPRERGNAVLEFAVVIGLLALAFIAITKFGNDLDAQGCGIFESCKQDTMSILELLDKIESELEEAKRLSERMEEIYKKLLS